MTTSNVEITTASTTTIVTTTISVGLNYDQMMADEMLLIPRKLNANFATIPTSITVARKTKKISSDINSKFMPIKTKRPGFKKCE